MAFDSSAGDKANFHSNGQSKWHVPAADSAATGKLSDQLVKDEFFVDDLLYSHETKFCTFTSVKIFVSTFNGITIYNFSLKSVLFVKS